jgi:hypothetical protein
MYVPFLPARLPSNQECRIASIETLLGFGCFAGLTVFIPESLSVLLAWMALTLALIGLGLPTLQRARPSDASILPAPRRLIQLRIRMGWGAPVRPLDERELQTRYRTFLVSYRILAGVIIATLTILLLAPHSDSPYFLFLRVLILLITLFILLPECVLPWLEPGTELQEEPATVPPVVPWDRTRILGNVAYWAGLLGLAWIWWRTVSHMASL